MGLKIKLVSDLHLEFWDITLDNLENADVLILSGDICVANDFDRNVPDFETADLADKNLGERQLSAIKYLKFFDRVTKAFPHVIYVAGNHELYHGTWVKTLETLKSTLSRFKNLHFLEFDTVTIQDVTFVGGTMWTDMNRNDPLTMHAITGMMYDFKAIRNDQAGYTKLRAAHVATRHQKFVNYVKSVVDAAPDQKFVVATHHSPCRMSISGYYADDHIMNGGYVSDLSELILNRPQIKLWTHGHLHSFSDYQLGQTRIVCNPRGYPHEHPESRFDPTLILEV